MTVRCLSFAHLDPRDGNAFTSVHGLALEHGVRWELAAAEPGGAYRTRRTRLGLSSAGRTHRQKAPGTVGCAVRTHLNSEGVAMCTQLGAQTKGGSGLGPVQLDCCVPSLSLVKSTSL